MYNHTDEIRQDRTKCYFFYTIEELMEYFEEIKKRRHKPQDDQNRVFALEYQIEKFNSTRHWWERKLKIKE